MPVESPTRPIGVTVLSYIAFAFSPLFVVLFVVLSLHIYELSAPRSLNENLWLCFWELVLLVCFSALVWVSYKAGLELSTLRHEGLSFTIFTMWIFLFIGVALLLVPGLFWKISGVAISGLSTFFLYYLRLPSIEKSFEPRSPESSQ